MRTRMEVAVYAFGFIAILLGSILTIVSLKGHAYLGLWLGVAAICATSVGAGCWLHDF